MSVAAAMADPDVISKGEFARRRNVTPGRVSQWLSEGKIFGAAIVGEGRTAMIRESVACQQLRVKLDPLQMTGNGLSTKLDVAPPAPLTSSGDVLPFPSPTSPPGGVPPSPPPSSAVDSVEEKIKRQRLEQLERQNREGARQEAVSAGLLTDAAAARAQVGRAVAQLVMTFEGALSEFATAISAEFKLPQRDVLHLLRTKFREVRAAAAGEIRNQVETLPQVVDHELAGDDIDQDETETS
ncbi:hypothetical protein [Bradyrhizobium sp. DOA9]|uniref:hypothetical protein n=1 Tax=Bradyrhizobium sp. DOA9 TaxID=1126627 RepID=UPI00072356A3|nr:hypothetical protein [Bradyrhizobium sp. DOA9]GAJ35155.1 hypothetical protein BDOA9_0143540 [Bradyrhizobium sp. DOA9]